MWSYYGAKTNVIHLYPKPKHDLIIEPFAGSARYALRHFEKDVLLVDKYDVIVKIWKWLQKCSEKDVLSLPHKMDINASLNDFTFNCIEEKLFMGFMINGGMQTPGLKQSKRKSIDRPNFIHYGLKRVASNLYKIRHWKIEEGTYEDIPNQKATWYIDPPYQVGGHCYKMSNKKIDFVSLAAWCKSREGQVMVCENTNANWMDFKPMIKQRGSLKSSTEAIWTNELTIYDNEQTKLIL